MKCFSFQMQNHRQINQKLKRKIELKRCDMIRVYRALTEIMLWYSIETLMSKTWNLDLLSTCFPICQEFIHSNAAYIDAHETNTYNRNQRWHENNITHIPMRFTLWRQWLQMAVAAFKFYWKCFDWNEWKLMQCYAFMVNLIRI